MSRRTIILSVAAVALLAAAVASVTVAVGGDETPAASKRGRFATAAPVRMPSPTGKPVAPSRPTLKSRPPARLFAGGASAVGILVRVCEHEACTALPQAGPKMLEAPNGAPLAFALAEAPSQAWLEIRPAGSAQAPARVGLSAGTLMAWAPRTTAGRYAVTLVARFDGSEARWLFGLKVTG